MPALSMCVPAADTARLRLRAVVLLGNIRRPGYVATLLLAAGGLNGAKHLIRFVVNRRRK